MNDVQVISMTYLGNEWQTLRTSDIPRVCHSFGLSLSFMVVIHFGEVCHLIIIEVVVRLVKK
jgi:hypothetical protein